MEIKNYYLLLELSVDPPEQDLKKIEEAIKKKQAQWSRERNHPTKGTLAQQYISLIPKIKKVMTDNALRRKEALKAQKILADQRKKKFAKIDRHIGILMGSGGISKNEVTKLAELNSIPETVISKRVTQREKSFTILKAAEKLISAGKTDEKNIASTAKSLGIDKLKFGEWLKKKEKEKFLEIDNYISHCIRRGYITSTEIKQVRQLHRVKEEAILRRIKCPIKKKGDPKADKPNPLDKTIEKLINDNLKIIGKSSLYEFLELVPNSDLEKLQKRSTKKEAEVRKISQKDAIATASGVIAGQCLNIFKTEETRKEYDLSRTLSRLGELNADIDIAGLDGQISQERLTTLVRTALKLGMDIGESYEYIQNYCIYKKWTIEKKKLSPEKKKLLFLVATSISAIIILSAVTYISIQKIHDTRLKTAYEHALIEAEEQTELEGKEVILHNFVKYNEQSEYTKKAEQKIKEIKLLIIEREFNKTQETAQNLYAKGKLEQAVDIYETYIQQYPKTTYGSKIRKKIKEISDQIETKEYNKLKSLSSLDKNQRINAYNTYLSKYPEGQYRDDVNKMISQMVENYFKNLKEKLNIYENQEDWAQCIALCDEFINTFKGTEQADDATGLKHKYQNKIQSQGDMAEMKQKAEARGTDYEGARLIYLEYLEANPELPSYLKKLIVHEIKLLDQKINIQKQAEKDWEEILAYNKNNKASLDKQIIKIKNYLKKYPKGLHTQEGNELLTKLKKEKAIEDEQNLLEKQKKEWQTVVLYCQNSQISLFDRIQKIEQYIIANPSGKYIQKAQLVFEKLQEQKRIEDERLREQQANLLRIQREKARISTLISRSGGRFIDNGNETITDTQTGLMWSMFDSFIELNQCITHQISVDYVKQLSTGGYQDWRLPTLNELNVILKNQPVFPVSERSKWFWTSETYWHGWNKNSVIMIYQRGNWEKASVSIGKCGSVLAVRK